MAVKGENRTWKSKYRKLCLLFATLTSFAALTFLSKITDTMKPLKPEKVTYARIVATGGINNQIIATVNALLLAKHANITVLLPFFSVQNGSKYSPIAFEAYFEVKNFKVILEKLGIFVSLVPPPRCEKNLLLPMSSGRKFIDILSDIEGIIALNHMCKVIKIENQWGVREWEGNLVSYLKVFEAFKIRHNLYKIYEGYKKNNLEHPYIALHARVERSWPTLYFNSDEEVGIKDEISGMLLHLEKINLNGLRNIFILSGRDCRDEIFEPLKSAGYTLQCIDSRAAVFEHTGEVGRESYQKALVDSLIAYDAEHFVGRYASSASYVVKLRRKGRSVSMYCASSGFMCSDCGRNCLRRRGVKRHYKSIRDMENCFFLPGCGADICVDRVSNSGRYTCKKQPVRQVPMSASSISCRKTRDQLLDQDGFKFWYSQCKKGKNECNDVLLRNCS